MRIALSGNPNSGKTTMFNALTGSNERVGNWAGVTVDKKEHLIKKSFCPAGEELIVVDLPGAYSMSPFTSEESVTSDYVKNEKPDVIVNIVDATNLSRSLFFTNKKTRQLFDYYLRFELYLCGCYGPFRSRDKIKKH